MLRHLNAGIGFGKEKSTCNQYSHHQLCYYQHWYQYRHDYYHQYYCHRLTTPTTFTTTTTTVITSITTTTTCHDYVDGLKMKTMQVCSLKMIFFSTHLSIANYNKSFLFLWQSVQLKTEARPPDAVVLLWQYTSGIACLSFLLRQSRARTVRDYCDACHVTRACRHWAHRHVHLGKTGVHGSVSVSMAATSPQTLAAFLKLGRSDTNFINFYHDQILTTVLSFDEQQASETMLCRWQTVVFKSLYRFSLALSRCFVLLKCSLATLQ